MTFYTYYDSPVQTLLLTSDGTALTGLYMGKHRHGPEIQTDWVERPDAPPFTETIRQLDAYFARRLTEFTLPLAPEGTTFQQQVWQELCRIPYGTTLSYGELARRIGNPNASRAVGLANGRNPISIIVPCHRVIGASGKLIGYGGGLARKEILLALEAGGRQPEQTSLFTAPEFAG
jgi:methylated-DNA-[protein]-cysteine S-methyltransferase